MSPLPIEAVRRGLVREEPREGTHPARVLAFLRARSDQAWRAHEIARALSMDPYTAGAALRRLLARGLIEKDGVFWFATTERDAAQLQAALAATHDLNERYGRENPADWAHVVHE